MSEQNICPYCETEFSRKYNLERHIKTNVQCLHSRNEKVVLNKCKYCDKTFVHRTNLTKHHQKCKIRCVVKEYEGKIQKLKAKNKKVSNKNSEFKSTIQDQTEEIKKLQAKNKELEQENERLRGTVEGMQKAPDKRTIYNTAIHPKLINLPISNVPALTQEFVEQKVNDGILTYSLAARGYAGMLEVICELITHENDEGIVERNYVCTDVSRNSFHRLLESKEWKADKGGRYLNSMLDTFQSIMEEYKDRVYNMYSETSHDSPQWRQVNWERKNISKLYGGVVCREGTGDREDLVNALRKDISKRAYV
jgi:predicted RNase H-like nuclease (RuvC/YqgF family)